VISNHRAGTKSGPQGVLNHHHLQTDKNAADKNTYVCENWKFIWRKLVQLPKKLTMKGNQGKQL